MVKVIIIVVNHNGSKWIDKCFGSLMDSSISVSVTAVDNGSSDGTQNIISQKFPKVEVFEAGQNLGFGRANNIGLVKALEQNFDYAFLLNQDAWIESTAIEKLVLVHLQNTEYGILSPLHFSGDINYLDKNFSNYINELSCPGLISDALSERRLKEVYETKFVNAAFWLISREVLKKVGGFDPLFFMYGEDDDYIRRVKYHGFKIGICPYALGYHDRPQIFNDSGNRTLDRLFSSKLIELKDTANSLPSKFFLYKALIKLKIKALLTNKNLANQIQLTRKIISNYNQIIIHRDLSKLSKSTFLNEEC